MTIPQTIPALVTAAAERWGARPAIEDDGVVLGFDALAAAAARATRAFLAAGLRPGDRAAVWAPNLHEWVIAALGIQGAGGVLVPLNTRLKGREAGYVLAKSGARLLCTVEEFLGNRYVDLLRSGCGGAAPTRPIADLQDLERVVLLRGAAEGCDGWDAFLAGGAAVSAGDAEARARAVGPDDLADLLFTSGTTGKPKGVMCTHAQNLRCFAVWCDVVGLRADDRYLIVNPYFHSFGYKAGWLACLIRGATNLPQAAFDVPQVLARIARDRVSVLPGPPTLYQTILAHPERARYDLSSLRLAVTGAAVIPVELIHRMRQELALETIVTAYGLTEATGVVTMCRPEDDPETIATTSGRAIPDVEVRCVDGRGVEVPRGTAGEIVVRGYNVMRGYFDDPAATAEAIDPDGWLHTGDVGVMDARGYLRITDRLKDMFITGGFNCYPAEIEGILLGCPGVAQAAVIGVPDERLGEVAMAFVVSAPGAALTPDAVVAWARENMANYKVPRRVAIVDALPTNATGKVTKFVLREQAARFRADRVV
jgi:acyl-CoA synthetase (AMP-forming)/AMP-acid ligase II